MTALHFHCRCGGLLEVLERAPCGRDAFVFETDPESRRVKIRCRVHDTWVQVGRRPAERK